MASGLSSHSCPSVMFHISGCTASLMLMCMRPCDRGLGDRDVERGGRGYTSGTAGTSAPLHEKKERQEIPSPDTEGEKS